MRVPPAAGHRRPAPHRPVGRQGCSRRPWSPSATPTGRRTPAGLAPSPPHLAGCGSDPPDERCRASQRDPPGGGGGLVRAHRIKLPTGVCCHRALHFTMSPPPEPAREPQAPAFAGPPTPSHTLSTASAAPATRPPPHPARAWPASSPGRPGVVQQRHNPSTSKYRPELPVRQLGFSLMCRAAVRRASLPAPAGTETCPTW